MAASAISLCSALGAVMWTTSIAGSAIMVRQSAVEWRETESVGGARGALFRDVGDGVQNRRHRQVEDLLRRGIAEDVRLPHEARADRADAERGLLRRARYQ